MIDSTFNCRFIGEFEQMHMVGEGTYGVVFVGRDKQTNETFAIKKMRVLDQNDGFPITSLREIKILKSLSKHPNIVNLKEVVVGKKKDSIFMVFEYCDIDLAKLVDQMYVDKISFAEPEIKCLVLQLVKGVSSIFIVDELCARQVYHSSGFEAVQPALDQGRNPQDRRLRAGPPNRYAMVSKLKNSPSSQSLVKLSLSGTVRLSCS